MTIRRLRRSVGLSESNRSTALKTISMFLRAAKTEAEAAGIETEGMASSVSKLRDEILTVTGVDIMLDENTFKSTYQILKEISSVWDKLADVDRANIAERLAGKRQGNILSSIVENFGEAEKVVKALADSEGSALEENEKYLDSIKGHSDQLVQTFERISTNVIDSDAAKVALDFLNSLAKVLEAITENGAVTAGVIGGIGLSISKLGFNKDKDGVQLGFVEQLKAWKNQSKEFVVSVGKDYDNMLEVIRQAKLMKLNKSSRTQIIAATNESEDLGLAFKSLSSNAKAATVEYLSYNKELTRGKKYAQEYKNSQLKLADTMTLTAKAGKLVTGVVSSIGNAILSIGITLAFSAIATALDKIVVTEKEALEAANEALGGLSSTFENIDGYIEKYTELKSKQQNTNLSTSEAVSINNELLSLQEQINKQYGTRIENINLANGDLQEQLNILKDISAEEAHKTYDANKRGFDTAVKNVSKSRTSNISGDTFYFYETVGFDIQKDALNTVATFIEGLGEKYGFETERYKRTESHGENRYTYEAFDISGELEGDVYSLYNIYKNMYDDVKEERDKYNRDSTEFKRYDLMLTNLSDERQKYEDIIKENESSALLVLQYESDYANAYFEILDKQAEIERHQSEGKNAEAIKAQGELQSLIDMLSQTANSNNDTWISGFLEYTYKDILERTFGSGSGNVSGSRDYILKNALTEYKADLDKVLETQDLLQSAYDKISQGTSLTREEFLKLVDAVPSLSTAFTQVADGYTADKNKIISANKSISESLRNSLVAELENVDIARSNALADFIESSVGSRAYEYMSEADKSAFLNAHPEEIAEIDRQYQETINSINTILGMLGIANIKLSEYNDELAYTAKLQKNLANLNEVEKLIAEGGQISTDMLQSIKEAYPELASYITAYTASYSKESGQILVNEFRKAYNTDVENFHTYLSNKNSVSKATDKSFWQNFIENNTSFVEEFKKAYGIDLVNFETYLDAKEEAVKNRAHYDYLPTSDLQKLLDETGTNKLEEKFNSYSYTIGSDTNSDDDFKVSDEYEKQVKFWDDQLERGLISYDAYLEKRRNLIKQYYADATAYAEALADFEYSVDYSKLFEEEMSAWERENNYDSNNTDSRIARAKQQQSLIDSYFSSSGTHPDVTQYENQLNELAKYEVETLEKQLEQGLISYSDYCSSVKSIRDRYVREDGSYVIPANFVTDLLTADKQYENSLKEWQDRHEYNDRNNKDIGYRQNYANEWRSIAEESYGANSDNYNPAKLAEIYKEIKEYEEETWELRKEYAKNYWEERKSEIEEYYDSQIEALQTEQEELDKINELEEKRLELIKARKELEDAQKNRNQLIFANGNFSYEYDQDAILDAQERVRNAEDALKKQETDDAIQALEDAKNDTINKLDDVITAIENQGSTEQKFNDSQVVDTALNEALNKGELSKDEHDSAKSAVVADNAAVRLTDSNIIEQIRLGTFAKTATEIAAMLMGTPIGANSVGTAEMQRLTDTATSTITNSTVNTDNSTHVTVGDIKVSVQGGISEAMLREFADGLANEINAMVTRRKR